MTPFREKSEYIAVRLLMALLRYTPEFVTTSLFRLFGALFFIVARSRRTMCLRNLALAFPEKSDRERRAIAWRCFLNIAEFSADSFLILSGKWTPQQIVERVDDSELSKVRRLIEHSDRGILYLTGHLGNWELLGAFGAIRGFKSHVIARRGSNRLIDDRIVTPLRTRHGNQVFYKENAIRNTIKALKRNEAVSFLIDQKIGPREGVTVRLFGHDVLAVASCALLQIRMQPLVIPAFMVKEGRRRYRLVIGDPVEWIDDGSPRDEQVQKLTQLHQNRIEEMVRVYPDQWFWMHNRFQLDNARTRRRRERWDRGE